MLFFQSLKCFGCARFPGARLRGSGKYSLKWWQTSKYNDGISCETRQQRSSYGACGPSRPRGWGCGVPGDCGATAGGVGRQMDDSCAFPTGDGAEIIEALLSRGHFWSNATGGGSHSSCARFGFDSWVPPAGHLPEFGVPRDGHFWPRDEVLWDSDAMARAMVRSCGS